MPPRDPYGFSGALIDGQLQVGDPVGEGGFSVVYRAHHVGLDEPVALKCLKAQTSGQMTEGIVERFRAESRISYRLSQGNLDIVRSISSGAAHSPMTGELVPYIALEWLDGPSLSKELKMRRAQGMTGRPLAEVIEILEPAAVALDYAHKQGVVHRDVKPGNLVLAKTREGGSRIKVLDFGLAKVIDPEGIGLVATAQTVASVILCSPAYGAPEQFDFMLGPIGSYTDVYSFALIVLEMLRDEKIRGSASIALSAQQALAKTPVSPLALHISVTPAIDALFQRTLQLDKTLRPKDMGEFWTELKSLAGEQVAAPAVGTAAAPPGPPGLGTPKIQDKPPQHNVTQPMQQPPSPPPDARDPAPPPPDDGGLAFKGTMIMPLRPPVSPARSMTPDGRPALGPVTAPMPAIPRGVASVPPPAPGPPQAPTLRTDPSPLAMTSPLPAPLAPPARPGANPPRRSPLKVALLVVLSFVVFSGLMMTAGYLAHQWYTRASRAP